MSKKLARLLPKACRVGSCAKVFHAVFAAGFFAIAPVACAQIATLDKGHQFLVNNGLQVWGLDQCGGCTFNYNSLANANFNGVLWSWNVDNAPHPKLNTLTSGQKWGKWADPNIAPASTLDATESSKINDLIALQIGDEQQTDLENPNGVTSTWLQAAHAGNYFPNQLLYVNSFYIGSDANYASFIATANPDAISFDSYPFDSPYGSIIFPQNWLSKAGQFRRHALSSYIVPPIGSNSPRPYGLYLQTYASGSEGTRDPGDVEMRWQLFSAWTMGFTFVDAFTVSGSSSLFNGGNMNSPTQPRYSQFAESARQSRNLSPALVRLISYGYGPSIVLGKNSAGATNPLPGDWLGFAKTNAPPNQQYLSGVSATNIGTKNNGQPGDVYVGFFNPLLTSYGDPAGTAYFMVMNALGAYLDDPTATVADCMQRITLDFNFGSSGINSLERLRRSDGQVEVVQLTQVTGNQYRLTFDLEGGTGDLFKYNDGTPFVGVELPLATLYWDNDGNAGNNNLTTGGGLGGSGTWDTSASKWYNGASNGPFAAGSNPIFWGTGGTVTLSAPQSAASLSFKSSGYTIAGSTLTLTGQNINVDSGASATISSVVAGSLGLVKAGAGTLNLTASNLYSGGTTINGGVLGIVSGALGANPASATPNITINNGATLRFNANNLTLSSTRSMILDSANGGVIDTNGNNDTIAGAISGGMLTKSGAGMLILSNTNSHSASIVNGGTLQVSSDGNLGTAPGTLASNLTLNGATLQFGGNFDIGSTRGITMGANGGTIDTNGFSTIAGYSPTNGFRGGDLTKTGAGTFYASAPTGGSNNLWTGKLILKQGIWKIQATDGLPINPNLDGNYYGEQVTFDGGTLQINNNISASAPKRGITIQAGGGTFDTQGFTFNWFGTVAGVSTATWTKTGSGTLQLNTSTYAHGTYNGKIQVAAGTLALSGVAPLSNTVAIELANAAGASLNLVSSETIGSLAGGGASGGNVTLGANNLTTGSSDSTFSGLMSGSGALTKNGAGAFTLAPAAGNFYTGGTTISAGTLLANNATGSATGTGAVVVNSGGTLGGTGAISGAVTVNSGGHIAPGASIESLNVGSLTLAAGSILDFELNTISSVDTSDLINVTTTNGLTINGGTLNLTNAGNMTDGTYMLIDYSGTVNGSLSNVTLGATPAGFTYSLVNNAASTSIDLVVGIGDFNGSGTVDMSDYVVWRKGLGTTYTPNDYDIWRAHYGQTTSSGAGNSLSAVPEPTIWLLLKLGCAILIVGGPRLLPTGSSRPRFGPITNATSAI